MLEPSEASQQTTTQLKHQMQIQLTKTIHHHFFDGPNGGHYASRPPPTPPRAQQRIQAFINQHGEKKMSKALWRGYTKVRRMGRKTAWYADKLRDCVDIVARKIKEDEAVHNMANEDDESEAKHNAKAASDMSEMTVPAVACNNSGSENDTAANG